MTPLPYTGTALAWPLYVAIAAVINRDPACRSRLSGDRVYNATVPTGTVLDYIVLDGMTESDYAVFQGGGSTGTCTIHLFCASPDNRSTSELYGELHRLLNRATIAVDGFHAATGSLMLVDIQQDEDPGYRHGVARLTLTALR